MSCIGSDNLKIPYFRNHSSVPYKVNHSFQMNLTTSLDHEIQKGYMLGVSPPHKLGPLLGFKKQVFASLRSGAVLYNGQFL